LNHLPRLLSCLLVLVALPGYSQDKSAFPFVDLGKAQALIDVLTKENETLTAESARLSQEADALVAQAVASQKGAADLVPLRNAVKARYSELASIEADLADKGLQARAAAASEKTLAVLKRLSARIDALGLKALDLGKQVENLQAQVSVDQARLVRNTDDIIVLQAALARTKAQQGRLEAVIGDLDSLSSRAETALK